LQVCERVHPSMSQTLSLSKLMCSPAHDPTAQNRLNQLQKLSYTTELILVCTFVCKGSPGVYFQLTSQLYYYSQ